MATDANPERSACFACGTDTTGRGTLPKTNDTDYRDCPNCGKYIISYEAQVNMHNLTEKGHAFLSHEIWKHQGDGHLFAVQTTHIDEAQKASLPNPAEQLDLFILYAGNATRDTPGQEITVEYSNLRAKICAQQNKGVFLITDSAMKRGLISGNVTSRPAEFMLTLEGWERYEELKLGHSASRTAFMAMPFSNEELRQIVEVAFRPAVEETGFKLMRVDDEPKAGPIDNKMRVDIMTSRFVIADLTDKNRGAYWEAGYAEGLGKPVIYTCEKAFFNVPYNVHFDTNHHHTILWESSNPEKAAEDLKATIRATLPLEAKM